MRESIMFERDGGTEGEVFAGFDCGGEGRGIGDE
jgi:hypothetical protein